MTSSVCHHCGEPVPAGTHFQATIRDRRATFCCAGCKAAAEWIEQLGLGDYYQLRSSPARKPEDDDLAGLHVWTDADLDRHVVRVVDPAQSEVCLLIEGMRCSACVWLIERSLGALAGVTKVQVNASASRARVVWDTQQTPLPTLLETIARAGYRALPLDARALDDARRHETRDALKRLAVAGFGSMQAMMYGVALYVGAFQDMDDSTRDLLRWIGFVVATPVVLYAAKPFFAGAWRNLCARRLGMDVPVALAVALIYAASLVEAFKGGAEVYFDSVSMFVFFLLLGRFLEMRARHRSGDLVDVLARMTPTVADRYREDGSLERVAATTLRAGDVVHVAEGGAIPADGVLLDETCRVDESLLTGESVAAAKHHGDMLVAGSVLQDGPVRVRVERVGADTALAGIVAMVTRAQTERPQLAVAGENAASRFVARVLALTVITAIGWSMVDPSRVLTATLAVLVVSCPCAFALAVPAAMTRALAVLAQRGVLVAHADAIETLALADHVVFDKTGTLTLPYFRQHIGDPEALALAVALARASSHPVAKAIAESLDAAESLPVAEQVKVHVGQGIEGTIAGKRLRLGRSSFALRGLAGEGGLADAVLLADDQGALAVFHPQERLRAGAAWCVSELQEQGLEVEIVSGDASRRVHAIASALGVSRWRAGQRPEDKLTRLQGLRAQGKRVIAVGDGINDAPVLAGADVSVAMGSGTQLAQASSDIVLTSTRLQALPEARRIAIRTLQILRQNHRWSLVYNLCVVPPAAFGLVPPWLAAIGMSTSSLFVVLNALRIGRDEKAQDALTREAHA
ncbi:MULTISPECIES: heavy metal translocating P-type ATPase [Dyella]|uniref:Cadmium-translocating P-type ATPase n=2 Tax=Dyella TaxID=231454 RepID=A0A4R0YZJ2_9GAMM|nr:MULTISPECIES: heavy metal translocating P-type ATPase [Dyella]TBR39644.1 cadmium-translocating P-type ATPase [Dyella terrae]TCI12774.1 cadmium-translocating P-type ATPase [Dyella soli]